MEASEDRNLRLLEEGMEAFNRGDLGWLSTQSSEDIEIEVDPRLLNTGSYRGRAEFQRWMEAWVEAWREITLEVKNVEQVGDRFLFVEVLQRAVGAVSGVPTEMELVHLIEVDDGKIGKFQLYASTDAARAALDRLQASD